MHTICTHTQAHAQNPNCPSLAFVAGKILAPLLSLMTLYCKQNDESQKRGQKRRYLTFLGLTIEVVTLSFKVENVYV